MPSAWTASRPAPAGGGRLTTKPPFEPTGTIRAFLTICAFIRPRISVRKSSRRSDQRSPPRATLPPQVDAPVAAVGIEADVEQLHEPARDVGVGEQRPLHVAVAERRARLAQV